MASLQERKESLKKFAPVTMLEYLDRDNFLHKLVFYPALNIIKIDSANSNLPPVAMSYSSFVQKSADGEGLNKVNKVDSLILIMRNLWGRMKKSERMEFCDNIPLNSLYIGGQYR